MPGYIALLIDINDQQRFVDYVRATAPVSDSYGGRIVLRGPLVEMLEGALEHEPTTRLVMVEFPTASAPARSGTRTPTRR